MKTEILPLQNWPLLLEDIEQSSANKNRGQSSIIEANTDVDVIKLWLAEKALRSKNTYDSYKLEAERFLLWVTIQKRKTVSDLTRADLVEFESFLRDLPDEWISKKRAPRTSADWRPFKGQLSPASLKHNLVVTHGILQYMVDTGWLKANPMPKPRQLSAPWSPTSKSLSKPLMDLLLASTEYSANDIHGKALVYAARDRWLLVFIFGMAARVSETIAAMGSIESHLIDGESCWVWNVTGKGNKTAQIPLPDWVVTEMVRFRSAMRLTAYPAPGESFPLVPALNTVKQDGSYSNEPLPMTRNSIYKRLTEHILPKARARAEIAGIESHDLFKLDCASVHWLRHTSLRELADETKDIRLVMEKARHANINTSAGYTRIELANLRAATKNRT